MLWIKPLLIWCREIKFVLSNKKGPTTSFCVEDAMTIVTFVLNNGRFVVSRLSLLVLILCVGNYFYRIPLCATLVFMYMRTNLPSVKIICPLPNLLISRLDLPWFKGQNGSHYRWSHDSCHLGVTLAPWTPFKKEVDYFIQFWSNDKTRVYQKPKQQGKFSRLTSVQYLTS